MRKSSTRRSVHTVLRGALKYIFGKRGQRRVHGLRLFYRLRAAALLHVDEPLHRLTRRTEVRLWVDGAEAFARIERLLSRARHTIVIQMFIWMDDATGRTIAQLVVEAADRGVQVEIAKEAVGDVFEYNGDFLATRESDDPIWRKFWNHPRIRISYDVHHDHAKVYVIDDQILLLTGMNIADEYREEWHDYLVELRGSRFVEQYLTEGTVPLRSDPAEPVRLFMNTPSVKQIRKGVTDLLLSAELSILLEQCYLSDPEVVDLLIAQSKRGIRVTLILPETPDFHYYANMQAVTRLLMSVPPKFLQVFLYPGVVHAKVILIDRKKMFLGSANMVASSLDEMGEVSVLIEGKYRIALMKLREVLRRDILKSKALTAAPRFGWMARWLAWFGL